MTEAWVLAMSSSLCFGIALITSRVGLRSLDARSGAAISVPTATILLALAAPFALDTAGFTLRAALWFAAIGVFFPALVTLLTFRSIERLGPTITSAVASTTPLFALLGAAALLGEHVAPLALIACLAVVVGAIVLTWRQSAVRPGYTGWALLWPIAGAVVRGLAQACAKAGLALWPSPLAASLIGYTVSSAAVIGTRALGRAQRPALTRRGLAWFALTGGLNGAAVLLMYGALSIAPVSLVAPIVATYPLVTVLLNAVLLREETVTRRMIAGAGMMVLGVVCLTVSGTGG